MAFIHGHALIIGIGTYHHKPQRNVPKTVADAQVVANVLKDDQWCGYPREQVIVKSNNDATRAGILAAMDKLAQQTSKADTVLLFYSGHGEYDSGGNYVLTTHDTQWQDKKVMPGTAISQAELLEKLRAIPSERMLLIFNACHAGEVSPVLGEGEEETPETGISLPNQTTNAILSAGSGRIIITACRANQVSFIGSGEHTLFTQALIDGLRGTGEEIYNRKGMISVFDLYSHLYDVVKQRVETIIPADVRKRFSDTGTQEPELTVLKGVGPFAVSLYRGASILGDFPTDHTPMGDAIREVDSAKSQRAFQHLVLQTVSGEGAVGIVGPVSNSPITTGSGNTVIQSGRDTIHAGGNVTQVGGDYIGGDQINTQGGTYVDGDQLNIQGVKGFINRPTGPITQHFGDRVQGDKISGDINVSGISGSDVTIGHKSQVNVQGSSRVQSPVTGVNLGTVQNFYGSQPSDTSPLGGSEQFKRYEAGIKTLLAGINRSHPYYSDALVYQQRLQENIAQARHLGDTETRRAERNAIIEQLNTLALSALGVSFNELCG